MLQHSRSEVSMLKKLTRAGCFGADISLSLVEWYLPFGSTHVAKKRASHVSTCQVVARARGKMK